MARYPYRINIFGVKNRNKSNSFKGNNNIYADASEYGPPWIEANESACIRGEREEGARLIGYDGDELNADREQRINNCTALLRRFLVIGIIIILIAVAFQATIVSVSAQDEEEKRTLSLGFIEKINSLNPFLGLYDAAYVYYGLVYSYMTWADEDVQLAPNLATSWWFMDGQTAASMGQDFSNEAFGPYSNPDDWPRASIWEYNLTENIFWSDGEPLTAEDIEWTINLQIGENFQTFWAFQPTTRWIIHCEAVDDLTIRIFYGDLLTGEPFSAAFGYSVPIPILAKHIYEDYSVANMGFDWDGTPVVGLGPFTGTDKIKKEFIAGEIITLVKNEYYNFLDDDGIRKGLGAAFNRTVEIDELLIKFFTDENTLQLAVISGDIDATEIDPVTYLGWNDPGYDKPDWLNVVKTFSCTGYTKNTAINAYREASGDANPLRLDPAVKRAMLIMTNKSYMLDQVFKGLGITGVSLIATPAWPDWWWEPGDELSTFNVTDGDGQVIYSYTKPMKEVIEYDIELANEILNVSGYDQWSGGEFGQGHRIAGDLAGERMEHIFDFSPSAIVGKDLEFSILVMLDYQDKQIAKILIEDWKKIGVATTDKVVSYAIWAKELYAYTYEIANTYWSGDIDPNYLCYITSSYALFSWNDFGINSPVYDSLLHNQSQAYNLTERKYWVDECIKWQYLSGSVISTIIPETCFAFSEERWTNWGDWENHSGFAIDHFWGDPPFSYNVKYIGEESEPMGILVYIVAIGILIAAVAAVAAMKIRRKKMEKLWDQEDKLDEGDTAEKET